jgi:hypothetical protein
MAKSKSAGERKRDAAKIPRLSSKLRTEKIKQERYVPLKNKARQYRDTKTGAIISRRQYTKALYTGGKSLEARAKELRARGIKSHVSRYSDLLRDRRAFLSKAGVKTTVGEIRSSEEMKAIMRDLRSRDKSLRGRTHRALVQLGRRDPNASYPPGESPTTNEGQ